MSDEWFYAVEDRQHGPVSVRELRRLASEGRLQPHDLVWQQGMRDWVEAASVEGLFAAPPPIPSGTAAGRSSAGTHVDAEHRPWGMDTETFCMLLHLGQFAGLAVPFAGLALPIVMWATEKDNSELVDAHGRNVLNWIVSFVIYTVVSIVLVFLIVGIPLFLALLVMDVVFPIIGAVKAKDGEVWKYPCSITFF